MTRDIFPATRERLLSRLDDSDVPGRLVDRVAELTPGRRFGGVHEVLTALGIASPETRKPSPGEPEPGEPGEPEGGR
jgi:hypothetical protein